MTNIANEIEKLNKELIEKHKELSYLSKLAELYPDLQKYVGRWGKTVYYSAAVNNIVNKYDMRHNCGCCSDSPLEIWPYLETECGKVYSDPPCFKVGEKYDYDVDRPCDGWEDNMRGKSISEVVISEIRTYFEGCATEIEKRAEKERNDEDLEIEELVDGLEKAATSEAAMYETVAINEELGLYTLVKKAVDI